MNLFGTQNCYNLITFKGVWSFNTNRELELIKSKVLNFQYNLLISQLVMTNQEAIIQQKNQNNEEKSYC